MSLKKLGKQLDGAIGSAQKKYDRLLSTKRVLPLDDIKDRPHGDTRELNPDHVGELVESIAAVGLIQPIAIDQNGYLLAGAHRRAALHMLREIHPATFNEKFADAQVPVRVFNFDATADSNQAIVIEAAENEKRRDYTPAEVRELAAKLIAAGYRNEGGKPKKGQKALTPALVTIIGKSRSTVQRYLRETESDTASNEAVSINKRQKLVSATLKAIEAMQKSAEFDDSEQRMLSRTASKFQKLLDE